jgi:hypothetical protein
MQLNILEKTLIRILEKQSLGEIALLCGKILIKFMNDELYLHLNLKLNLEACVFSSSLHFGT